MEEERLAHEQKLSKMESEMRAVFQAKVTEKEAKLKQSEAEVNIELCKDYFFCTVLNCLYFVVICTS
jgi:septin family protein